MEENTNKLWGALIGLAGACANNGFSGQTARLIVKACALLASCKERQNECNREGMQSQKNASHTDGDETKGATSGNNIRSDIEQMLMQIHAERDLISPGCATCEAKCGNTDDYDMTKLHVQPEELQKEKRALMETLMRHAAAAEHALENGFDLVKTGETWLKGIAYLSYALETNAYRDMRKELDALAEEMQKVA